MGGLGEQELHGSPYAGSSDATTEPGPCKTGPRIRHQTRRETAGDKSDSSQRSKSTKVGY